jgi:hypothetical protein
MFKQRKLKWWILWGVLMLWLIGAIGVGIQVYSHPPPLAGATRSTASIAEVVSSVFAVLGGLSVILMLYFNIWTLMETRESQIVENTFDLIKSWDDPALLAARKLTRELGDRSRKLSPEQLVEEINSNPELRQSVVHVFNFVEWLGYSFRTERVDRAAVSRSLGPTLTAIHQRLLPWIEDMDKRLVFYRKDLEDNINLLRPQERQK